jgi:hypothetical protein
MSKKVRYELELGGVDKFEHGMSSMKGHADMLEGSMHHLKLAAIEMIGAYAGFETLKASLEEFTKHKVAVAELSQMYENNSKFVGTNLESLKELAEKQEELTGIHSENTMAAEQSLMKYRDLKVSYEQLIPLSANLATALHTDVAEAANLLGRSLENPLRAMRLLMQTGASPKQLAMYQALSKTGHAAKAQAYLVDILNEKYKDLAKTAFDNDAMAQMEVGFKRVKESVGELVNDGLVAAMPYIKEFFHVIKDAVHWIEQNKEMVKGLAVSLGVAAAAYYTINGVIFLNNLYLGYTAINAVLAAAGIEGMTIAQAALNAVMSVNPILAVVSAIALLTYQIYECVDAYEKMNEASDKSMHGARDTEIKAVQDLTDVYVKYGDSIDVARKKAIAFEKEGVVKEIAGLQDKLDVEEVGTEAYARIMRQLTAARAKQSVLTDSVSVFDKKTKGSGKSEPTLAPQSEKVSGTKQVIINVSINKLVELIKIVAANTKEGINQAGPDVAKALMGAVNQFSASTDI